MTDMTLKIKRTPDGYAVTSSIGLAYADGYDMNSALRRWLWDWEERLLQFQAMRKNLGPGPRDELAQMEAFLAQPADTEENGAQL